MIKKLIFVSIVLTAFFLLSPTLSAEKETEDLVQIPYSKDGGINIEKINFQKTNYKLNFPCQGVGDIRGTPCYEAIKLKSGKFEIKPFTLLMFNYSCTMPNYDGNCPAGGGGCFIRFSNPEINLKLTGKDSAIDSGFFLEPTTATYRCRQCTTGSIVYSVKKTDCEIKISQKTFGSCDNFCNELFGGNGEIKTSSNGKKFCDCYCKEGYKKRKTESGVWECYIEELPPEESPEKNEKPIEEYKGPIKKDISNRFKNDKKWKDTDTPIFTGGEKLKTREEKVKFVEDVFGISLEGFDENIGKGKKVYIIYNDSIDEYREAWLGLTKQSAAAIYMAEVLKYTPEVVYPKNSDEAFDYMVDPKAGGIIYFAHQHYSSLEEVEPADLSSQFKMALMRHYRALGHSGQEVRQLIEEHGYESLRKDFFLSFSCHSADNPEMIERTVKEGGIYYGHKGTLHPTEGVDEYVRPYNK